MNTDNDFTKKQTQKAFYMRFDDRYNNIKEKEEKNINKLTLNNKNVYDSVIEKNCMYKQKKM